MRTEQEMYDLIIGTAQADERVRAVYMNGSRTNPNVPKDLFQDYDIVYVVTETKPFYEDRHWIDRFGERLYMQMPDELDRSLGKDTNFDECYGWLIQFEDGNRIDLHVEPVRSVNIEKDKLCRILLDKDGILPAVPCSTDEAYRVKKPSRAEFYAVCNEFWWCLNNVAKGLWRGELPYVHDMMGMAVRPQLIRILTWKIGFETDFGVSVGKSAKYMYRWLQPEVWDRFLKTYGGVTVDEVWSAVFIMCDLFDETATEIAERLGCEYHEAEAKNGRIWLERVKDTPRDAREIGRANREG